MPLVLLAAIALADAQNPTGPSAGGAVYDVSPAVDGSVIGGAGVLVVGAYALSSRLITPRCPCNPSEVNGFDRWVIGNHSDLADVVSTVTVALAVAAPLALDATQVSSLRTYLEDATVLAESLAVTGALVTIAKYTTQRPLPRVYAGQAPALERSARGYRSFFSGHTSVAFAALSTGAMTLRLRRGENWWPWAVTVAVGSSVALERLAAGYHFPTDVIVGAIVGTGVGVLVPWLHRAGAVRPSVALAGDRVVAGLAMPL